MEHFDDIRPYHDHEVQPTLERLLKDKGLTKVITHYQYPRLSKALGAVMEWLVQFGLTRKLKDINNVDDFQALVEPFLDNVLEKSCDNIQFSGLEKLNPDDSYLFLSNHRDIVMDPALVNLAIYRNKMKTVRIAIGDNLLQKPFVSDLMRLNKSFIVKRSVTGRREKLSAYQTLSEYISHSIDTGNPVWIAHSEGRAKDGNDRTDSAIIKMFYMSRKKQSDSFAEAVKRMKIVPVAISYEYDPCDTAKARELYQKAKEGNYEKVAGEDIQSIITGIEGYKGQIHVAFGTPLNGDFEDAGKVVQEVDQQIHSIYKLYAPNLIAFDKIRDLFPELQAPSLKELLDQFCPTENHAQKITEFEQRLEQCPEAHRMQFLTMYANPVINYVKRP